MFTPRPFRLPSLMIVLLACSAAGCQSPKSTARTSEIDVRTDLQVTDGRSGIDLTWNEFMTTAIGSDVIVLGEEHDDATGHAVQLAVVEDVLDHHGHGVVALEMLERDEQILIEDYRDGIINADAFAKATSSTSWSGAGSWDAWYQPIIDAAIEREGMVIAANAPRRYVRLARTSGREAIENLPDARRELVVLPATPIEGTYRDRFFEIMQPADQSDLMDVDLSHLEPFFLAQQVWDATMADSVAQAIESHGGPVILLVGRFHSDHDGGTITELQRLLPEEKILSVSLETNRGPKLRSGQDVPQADIIVMTRSVD